MSAPISHGKPAGTPIKRSWNFSEDAEGENVDPDQLVSPSKKSKSGVVAKPLTFSMTPAQAMPPPPVLARHATPARASMSSPRAPMTAPAGRSPKRKIGGRIAGRRVSAPFSRVDPPFAIREPSDMMPFSLDAALQASLPSYKSIGVAAKPSMQRPWFFNIYEDTMDEANATLMEHSTLTLDLSSDDETSLKEQSNRGKENVPPEDYDASMASRSVVEDASVPTPRAVKKADIVRNKVVSDVMDYGQRSPLCDLETDSFVPEGLDKHAHFIVDGPPEKAKSDVSALSAEPVPFAVDATPKSTLEVLTATVGATRDVKRTHHTTSEISICEDHSSSELLESAETMPHLAVTGPAKAVVVDENTQPTSAEDVL